MGRMHPSPDERNARMGRTSRDFRETLRDALLVTHVEGMHCHRCEEAIVKSVSALTGVREVEVDFATGQASIIFDPHKIATHQVIAAIEAAGYRCPDAAPPEYPRDETGAGGTDSE